jgi:sulfite reductase beta subunit-like hemoprotein
MNSLPLQENTELKPKLNRVERLKKEKDPFEVWEAIERYAVTGFESIEPDDVDRFKWYGIYTQRSTSDPTTQGYFMLRIKLPNGDLNSTQLRTIASLTQRFAQGVADFTDRQNFQLHWVRIENIPTIRQELEAVGISIKGASGDTVRNVIGCPLAGYDPTELINAWPLVEEVNRILAGNSELGKRLCGAV